MRGPEQRLSLAVQKGSSGGSGRLTEESIELLKGCDFKFRVADRLDSANITNYPMDILSMRNRDIPRVLEKGLADLGIVGLDIIVESEIPLVRLMPLGYGQCKLGLGVREDVDYEQVGDLKDSVVATSYPNISGNFFESKSVPVDLLFLEGSVELAGFRRWARGIVEIIGSGDSMTWNGLDPKEILFESEAWLVASPKLKQKKGSEGTVEEFLTRSLALLRTRLNRFISVNAPISAQKAIRDIIPSSLTPTITQCVDPSWVDISSVVPAVNFWDLTKRLKEAGARDIVELEMQRIVPNKEDPDVLQMMAKIYS